jgi:hypothetical protein
MVDNILNGIATLIIFYAMIYAPAWIIYQVVKQIIKKKNEQ